ncbi:PstS family phosphate ABC transporter substrate-binding protein [Nocardia fluminea]|uniref:Phosphate ABC transporter substrate-binding protein (PhoT family) n=1 Tax=Nocardia fluminea TaxID=134984 RepID=A0A2N3VFV1_9NOCA|nr:substrate-binding domain-containing protein [Nocardia fluminea]PKV80455.1 phosphate ABC transporter substrate-binding protein (PhoT family) [Nocardia fluminea]
MDIPVELIVSGTGLAVASAAFVREFVLVGRRRLGYRFQMDTPVTGETDTASLVGALANLSTPEAGGPQLDLSKLSVVLIRVENGGTLAIDPDDYTMSGTDPRVGLHVTFPGREVIGLAVTELDGPLPDNLGPGSGIGKRARGEGENFAGIIDLPKVQLERRQHYKILAVLKRVHGDGEPAEPVLTGRVKRGKVVETTSHSGPSKKLMALTGFLVALIAVQAVLALQPDPPPRDCAEGDLTLVGSTAMAPMIRTAARNYAKTCTGAKFAFDFAGTSDGLVELVRRGPSQETLAISDGPKGNGFDRLVEYQLALSSFSIVTHPGVALPNLTTPQVRDLYRGNIKNWNQIGGPDQPVVLIDREAGSGTRTALEKRLLEDNRKVFPFIPCAGRPSDGAQCEVRTTEEVASYVAETPGAVGYMQTSAVSDAVRLVSLDGITASEDTMKARTYPLTVVEYADTHGQVAGDSLSAQFIDYLIHGQGRAVIREFGNIPCLDSVGQEICTP